MDIKTLQSNFTTPEQSKRLLELGVQADSADCCLRRILTDGGYCETWRVDVFDFTGQVHDDYLPCWSVGRLIEIALICATTIEKPYINFSTSRGWSVTNNIDYMMSIFVNYSSTYMDFSKLDK